MVTMIQDSNCQAKKVLLRLNLFLPVGKYAMMPNKDLISLITTQKQPPMMIQDYRNHNIRLCELVFECNQLQNLCGTDLMKFKVRIEGRECKRYRNLKYLSKYCNMWSRSTMITNKTQRCENHPSYKVLSQKISMIIGHSWNEIQLSSICNSMHNAVTPVILLAKYNGMLERRRR
jgi:hypothetical protein